MIEDFRFTMVADVYHADHEQDEYGSMVETWRKHKSDVMCELSTASFGSSRYTASIQNDFFDAPLALFGRFREDIRQGDNCSYPIDAIMITNVRSGSTNAIVYLEPLSEDDHNPMMISVNAFQPFTNPWGIIEYYKVHASRMQDQNEVLND